MSSVYLIAAMVLGWLGGWLWESRRRYSIVRAHRAVVVVWLCTGAFLGGFAGHYLTLRGWL